MQIAQDLTGIFLDGQQTEKEREEGGVAEPGKVRALRMFCPTASPRSVAGR